MLTPSHLDCPVILPPDRTGKITWVQVPPGILPQPCRTDKSVSHLCRTNSERKILDLEKLRGLFSLVNRAIFCPSGSLCVFEVGASLASTSHHKTRFPQGQALIMHGQQSNSQKKVWPRQKTKHLLIKRFVSNSLVADSQLHMNPWSCRFLLVSHPLKRKRWTKKRVWQGPSFWENDRR